MYYLFRCDTRCPSCHPLLKGSEDSWRFTSLPVLRAVCRDHSCVSVQLMLTSEAQRCRDHSCVSVQLMLTSEAQRCRDHSCVSVQLMFISEAQRCRDHSCVSVQLMFTSEAQRCHDHICVSVHFEVYVGRTEMSQGCNLRHNSSCHVAHCPALTVMCPIVLLFLSSVRLSCSIMCPIVPLCLSYVPLFRSDRHRRMTHCLALSSVLVS